MQQKITATDELPARISSCQPINHIYFLRTHKTASSTTSTILLSYGINKNHTIILDPDLADRQWPALLELNKVSSLVQSDAAKIFCTHIRFNKEPINSVFPKTKAKYITIIRNPVDRFKSAWMFHRIVEQAGISNNSFTINTFLKSPNALKEMGKTLNKTKQILNCFSNPNLFDMGFEREHFQNMTLVRSYIDKMDREFDLVMITDYFNESLILLKRLLCWEFEDIVYIKLRVNKRTLEFEEDVKKNTLTWNHADAILFDHFNKTFWGKVRQAGSTFYEDLETFRRINQEYQTLCESTEDKIIPKTLLRIRRKCTLSKTAPCIILDKLWKKRGNSFSGSRCGPISNEIAKRRRKSAKILPKPALH
ncbi:galactosylceramide sulfotransferase-like [Oculina patagonica]